MKKQKILFIDRDGTIINEPKCNFQIDSLDKLEFIPGVIGALSQIRKLLDFELVMVTNQDGLGTSSFPLEQFYPAHNLMLKTLAGEGIDFLDIQIDRSFESENLPTRKPRTGLLQNYITGQYDLENSFVIGDRQTDLELAKNLGCQGIFYSDQSSAEAVFSSNNWQEIFKFLLSRQKFSRLKRETNETKILLELYLFGTGRIKISTGLKFFDHMLEQLAKHGGFDLELSCQGDLEVDQHHTIEDCALALAQAFKNALGDKKGIQRFSFLAPMDEALSHLALDLSGRSYLVWDVKFTREYLGDVPTEMFEHFFRSFCNVAECTLNIRAEGQNNHHIVEAIFKSFGRCLRFAVSPDGTNALPSTKGIL